MFLRDDSAVSPVVGYILTFAITSGLLIVTLLASTTVLNDQHLAATRTQFSDLAHRIANAVEEALYVVDANPAVTYEKRLPLPGDVRGFTYNVTVTRERIYVNATNRWITTDTVIHNPDGIAISGTIARRVSGVLRYDPTAVAITLIGGD